MQLAKLATSAAFVNLLSAGGPALFHATAHAQDFPSRNITIIVGFPAGGGNDIVGRLVGFTVGCVVGCVVGCAVGCVVGCLVGCVVAVWSAASLAQACYQSQLRPPAPLN